MTPITPTTPGPGKVPGFEAICGCGLRMTNAFESNLAQVVRDHIAWHVRVGDQSERSQVTR